MKIIVDAMGGDHAPQTAVLGAALAAESYGEQIVLVGQEQEIRRILQAEGKDSLLSQDKIEIRNATEIITMHDDPSTALRQKPDASLRVAFDLLKKGEGDALVSAGNTGALLTGATLFGGRIKGIRRGAVAPVLPCEGGQVMLCDAGANTECTAEMLLQFAFLGALYTEKIGGIANPRVGLVNNGTEDSKGDALRKEAYALLFEAGQKGRINFVGNVEGSGVLLGACDVAVCDGYTGNVLLKTVEGTAKFLAKQIKAVFSKNIATKMGYLACKKGMDEFRGLFDQDRVGGAPFLGIAKPVIKAHGSSSEIAIRQAVFQAIAYTKSGMIEAVQQNIDYMTLSQEG